MKVKTMQAIPVVAGILVRDGKIMISRRPAGALGKAHALAFPVLLMQLLMDEGPGMAPLIDPVHPDHRAVGVDGGGLGRLVERAALRTEIIGIIIVGLTALIASHFAHNATRPFISLPV